MATDRQTNQTEIHHIPGKGNNKRRRRSKRRGRAYI